MGTASNLAPALRHSFPANMAALNSSADVVCQSAAALSCRTRPVISKTTAKMEQAKYWSKIKKNAITNFPQLMNTEERLEDRRNNLFKGVLIGVATSRARPGAAGSFSTLVSKAKTRATVRSLVTIANALSQCRNCSVVLTRIDTTIGFKSSAPSVALTSPLKSAACATSRAKSTTANLRRISSAVVPRPVSLAESDTDTVSTNTGSGSVVRATSQITKSETVGYLNTRPFATPPQTRAAVRAAALATAIASQCRDCRVVLRRIDATSEFQSAAPNVTSTATHLGSASCAKSRAKSDGLDVTSLTSSSNTRVISRAKTRATCNNVMQQPKTRAAIRAAFGASAMTSSKKKLPTY